MWAYRLSVYPGVLDRAVDIYLNGWVRVLCQRSRSIYSQLTTHLTQHFHTTQQNFRWSNRITRGQNAANGYSKTHTQLGPSFTDPFRLV